MCYIPVIYLAKVLSLRNNGISACMVGGASDIKTEDDAIKGRFPLVFVTPEKVIGCLIGGDPANKTGLTVVLVLCLVGVD